MNELNHFYPEREAKEYYNTLRAYLDNLYANPNKLLNLGYYVYRSETYHSNETTKYYCKTGSGKDFTITVCYNVYDKALPMDKYLNVSISNAPIDYKFYIYTELKKLINPSDNTINYLLSYQDKINKLLPDNFKIVVDVKSNHVTLYYKDTDIIMLYDMVAIDIDTVYKALDNIYNHVSELSLVNHHSVTFVKYLLQRLHKKTNYIIYALKKIKSLT